MFVQAKRYEQVEARRLRSQGLSLREITNVAGPASVLTLR